jgi:hypothetical protein
MSYPSSSNHWGIFLVLILLLMGHPRSYDRRLLQLSSVINATRNSLHSLSAGMDSLQVSMRQRSSPAPAAFTETTPPVTETQTTDPQTTNEEEITTANLSLV